jgi:hypothetical protein
MEPDKQAPSSPTEPGGNNGLPPLQPSDMQHDMPATPAGGSVISPAGPSSESPAPTPAADTSDAPMAAPAPAPMPASGPSPVPAPDQHPLGNTQPMDWMNTPGASGKPQGMVGKKRKKPLIIGIISGALAVVLIGASAAAYYVYNKPQNVLDMALLNSFSTSKVKSVNFEGKLQVKPKGSPAINASFTGAADANGAMDFSGSLDAFVTNLTFDAKTPDGSTYYVRLGGLGALPQLLSAAGVPGSDQLGPVISGVNNQWIEINQSIIQQMTGQTSDFSAKLSDADRSKIVKAYRKHKFLTVTDSLPQQTIKGRASYHYRVKVDAVKLKEFAAALKGANLDSIKLTQSQLKTFDSGVNSAHLDKYPFEIWVAKSGRLIDQVALSTAQDGDTATVRFTVDDYNKPVTVTKPADSKSLLDILSSLLGSGLLQAGASDGTGSTSSGFDLGNGISL